MASIIRRIYNNIENLAPKARPQDVNIAIIIINACSDEKYTLVKYILNQLN